MDALFTPINFARGVPDPQSFPTQELQEMTRHALHKHAGTMLQYGPAAGYQPLRNYIASWYNINNGNVLIGNGSLELFGFLCEASLSPGDCVFVENPTYDRALTALRRHKLDIIGIDSLGRGIDLGLLEEKLKRHRPKLFYLIPDFQNPSGARLSLRDRQAIVTLSEQYGFIIVEDGPYRHLQYEGSEIASFHALLPKNTVHLCSFTKLISPGIRIGFLIGPDYIIKKVAQVAENHYITPGYFAQGVVAEWCWNGLMEQQLVRLKAHYSERMRQALAAIDLYLPGHLVARPLGGFFAGLRFEPALDEAALLKQAARHGVTLSSGNAFFTEPPPFTFLRLPFCALDPAQFSEGVRRLATTIDEMTPRATPIIRGRLTG